MSGMTLEELDRADALWPDVRSPWDAMIPIPNGLSLGELAAKLERRSAARARLLALRGRARYTARGWDIEQAICIGDASSGIGGCWLCYRDPSYWESSWTRDLTGFDPLDGAAREVLAFVALQIERDHHLGDRARAPQIAMAPPRDAHMRYLREFLRAKAEPIARQPG